MKRFGRTQGRNIQYVTDVKANAIGYRYLAENLGQEALMGNAISFRLNPKNESDKKILDWLEEKSSQPGFFNLTEVIKKAILTTIEDEQKENREKSIEDWISEAILLSREEFTKIVKESSQTVANNVFAGVLGAMAQQVNMGAVPMSQMIGMVPNSVPVNGSIHVTDVEALDNELAADTSAKMDNSTKSMLGSLFDMDDD